MTDAATRAALRAPERSELYSALAAYRHVFISVGAVSGVLNVLMLSGSFFMLLVYDDVLPSRSTETLIGLVVLILALFIFQGALDFLRARMLVQIGAAVDAALSRRIYDLVARTAPGNSRGDGLQPLRDLDQMKAFVSGQGLLAFFDLPWMVLYLGICFAFHLAIGAAALAGAILLVGLTLLADRMTRDPVRLTASQGALRNGMAETNRQNAEVIRALGMRRRMESAWSKVNDDYQRNQQTAAAVSGGFSSLTKVLRLALQSMVLATGAYLVLQNKATGGVIIASSILTSRSLAPVELAIANWRGFIGARQSWARLRQLLNANPASSDPTPLPAPCKSLSIEAVTIVPPGSQRVAVQDVTLALKAGDGLGIVGPSGSGKSSLARAVVGVWRPARGKVRIDGAALDQWDDERLGRHVGYLPQDVELFTGTVAQNIARFDPDSQAEAVITAATHAHVHELILRLPEGYETEVGPRGHSLSAGQAQRIALARALYLDPFLVVLDEPNSNLDAEGEQALTQAITEVRARGGIAVVVAHRPSALAAVDLILVIGEGRVQAFGRKDEVLPKILPGQAGGRPS